MVKQLSNHRKTREIDSLKKLFHLMKELAGKYKTPISDIITDENDGILCNKKKRKVGR